MRFLKSAILALLIAPLFAGFSFAQQCPTRDKVADFLLNKHQEYMTDSAVTSNGMRVEVFQSKDGKTWTLIVVRGDGCAAPVAEGVSWEQVARPFPVEPRSTINPGP